MAGILTIATRNALLDSLNLKTIQLHSADPTDTGLVGVVAGASKDFTMSNASAGAVQTVGSIEIDINVVSDSITVSHYSLWDNSTTPKLVATGLLSSAQNYVATGKYIVNTLSVDLNQ